MKTTIKLILLCLIVTPFVPAIGLGFVTTIYKSWEILHMMGQGIANAFAF